MNRATRKRLEQTGLWEPSSVLDAPTRAPKTEDERLRAQFAERDRWVREVGRLGWQQELDHRRAVRTARSRARRTAAIAERSAPLLARVETPPGRRTA